MISHCANPECGAPFHYLRGGRLYRFEINPPGPKWREIPNALTTLKPERATVYFWLCEECSATHELKFSPRRGLLLRRLPNRRGPAPGAPVVVSDPTAEQEEVLTCAHCRRGADRHA